MKGWILLVAGFAAMLAMIGSPLSAQDQSEDNSQVDGAVLTDEVTNHVLVMVKQPPVRIRPGEGYSSGYGNARSKASRARYARRIAKKYGLAFVEYWPMPSIKMDCFVMVNKTGKSTEELIAELQKDPRINWAEPMQEYETLAQTGSNKDPLYTLSPAAEKWQFARFHRSWTGRNVSVAVIDSAVDANHPDLKGRVSLSKNFVRRRSARAENHGTEVAGIIAANGNNGIGSVGVAPGTRIMALRACWQKAKGGKSVCSSLTLAQAIDFAIQRKAKIINMSLGGPPNRLLAELLNKADESGIAVVAAYHKGLPRGGFPASHKNVIAVGDGTFRINRGYSAPGTNVPTTKPGGKWGFVSGSSYAAAHVSGLLALSYERHGRKGLRWQALAFKRGNREVDLKAWL